MYPCARRVGSADPTNQSENRSNVRSLDSPPQTLTRLHGSAACVHMPDGLPCDACHLDHIARSCPGAPDVRTHPYGPRRNRCGTMSRTMSTVASLRRPLMLVLMDPYGPRRNRCGTMSRTMSTVASLGGVHLPTYARSRGFRQRVSRGEVRLFST